MSDDIWAAPVLSADDSRLLDAYRGLFGQQRLQEAAYTGEFERLVSDVLQIRLPDLTTQDRHKVWQRLVFLKKRDYIE